MTFVPWRADPDSSADDGAPLRPPLFRFLSAADLDAYPDMCPDGKPHEAAEPRWRLLRRFGYVAEDGRYFVVPRHTGNPRCPENSTDLASVPPFLWGVLAPYGHQLRPALLHDHRCDVAAGLLDEDVENRTAAGGPVPPGRAPIAIRHEADDLFREALAAQDVAWLRRSIFWTGVSFGRFLTYQQKRAWVLVGLVGLIGLVALRAGVVALGGGPSRLDAWLTNWPGWLVLVGALVVLGFLLVVLKYGPVFAVAVPGCVLGLCLLVVGTTSHAPWVLGSLRWHAAVWVGALLLAFLVGLTTDWRAAMIAALIAPVVLPVVIVTVLGDFLLALPDQLFDSPAAGHPASPTLRWNGLLQRR